jgi:hypothetical protein
MSRLCIEQSQLREAIETISRTFNTSAGAHTAGKYVIKRFRKRYHEFILVATVACGGHEHPKKKTGGRIERTDMMLAKKWQIGPSFSHPWPMSQNLDHSYAGICDAFIKIERTVFGRIPLESENGPSSRIIYFDQVRP